LRGDADEVRLAQPLAAAQHGAGHPDAVIHGEPPHQIGWRLRKRRDPVAEFGPCALADFID